MAARENDLLPRENRELVTPVSIDQLSAVLVQRKIEFVHSSLVRVAPSRAGISTGGGSAWSAFLTAS
jgi:hypothetical protein